jgi:hypothetical protein
MNDNEYLTARGVDTFAYDQANRLQSGTLPLRSAGSCDS